MKCRRCGGLMLRGDNCITCGWENYVLSPELEQTLRAEQDKQPGVSRKRGPSYESFTVLK